MKKKLKTRYKILIAFAILLLVIIGCFYIYTLDYYRASDEVQQLINEEENILIEDDYIIVKPEASLDQQKGLIFYPGGKVEAVAYLPLLNQLAKNGLTCILVEMPMNLAVFDIDAADKIYGDFPEIKKWYIAGHSLGGAMASSYMKENSEKVEGLILLGAYPINDAPVEVLTLYGTFDIKLDLEKVQKADKIYEIQGGNHAYFGNYGEQEGDGIATISRDEQQKIAVKEILKFILE